MKLRNIVIITSIFISGFLTACGGKEQTEAVSQEGEKKDERVITLSDESLKNIDLSIAPVERGNLNLLLKVTGHIALNQNKSARITSTIEGRVSGVSADLNDKVKKGQTLATIESPELLGKEIQVKSPIDGIVIDRAATTGEQVDKSKELFTISDPTDLWLIAEVKEKDIGAMRLGQDATFQVLSYPDRKFIGKVLLVGTKIEEGPRTLEVRISAQNSDGLLKAGMFADVSIATTAKQNVLTIPDEALQTEGDSQVVFVALDKNKFEKRDVKTGLEEGNQVEVLDGLSDTDKVVANGSFVLKSELEKSELGEE